MIYYLCPEDDAPSDAVRVIYRHVDVLDEAGVEAAVLHAQTGFACSWFEHATRVAYLEHTAFGPDDVVAIPETYGPDLGTLFPGVRKVVFNQNAYNTFNGYGHDFATTAYHHPEVEAAIVVSEDNADYLRSAFPHLKVLRTVNRIDPTLFRPAESRRRRIAYMTRRGLEDAAQVLALLRARGALDGVELLPLDGLGEREVAAALHDSLIFLTLGTHEGCPRPPKEAMASGCLTVGYHGRGGREFMTPDVAFPVEAGDVVTVADTVERLLAAHPGDPAPLPATGRAAAASIHERHSPARERESVLAVWSELLGRPAEAAPLASIAILTLNGIEHTRACLESLERWTPEPHEVLLVDNGSTDGTLDYLRGWVAERPHAKLVANGENRGFAGGNNQALALARGRHLVLLNNDTILTPGWLSGLVAALERTPGAGVVGPVSNYVSGAQLVESHYTRADEVEGFARAWAQEHAGETERAGRLVGFCLLFTRAVLDAVGALDESFGSGNCEDDDFGLRARIAGHSLVIARDVFVHHTGSQTFAGARIDYRASIERNRRVFEDKWGCSLEQAITAGPAGVDPGRRARLVHLPLPAPPALDDGSEGSGGEAAVERLLLRGRDAVLAGDHDGVRDCFAAPADWQDRQRAYQAVRHLTELVLTAGDAIEGDAWLRLYEAAADGLLGVLERDPAEPVLLNVAGVLLYELTEADAAAALFDAGLRLDPELGGAEANRAAAHTLTARLRRPRAAALAERARAIAQVAAPAQGLTLSLCVIVKDEEEMLPGCLAAARDAVDEIVVVDTGSSDRTVAIAEEFGAKVVHFPWNGSFADARNVSLAHATGDWILYLDADEHLAEGSGPQLRSLLGKTWREAFYLLETNFTGADDAGTAVSHPAMRVFRNRPEYRFEGKIHEQKTRRMPTYLPERFETTEVRVSHYGYLRERVVAKDKSKRNLDLLAADAKSPFASFNLGSEYQLLGDWERASTHFDEAWDELHREQEWHDVGYAPLLALRGARAHRECGRIDRARAMLAEAIPLWRDYTDLVFELAVCAQATGQLDEAERLLRLCVELGDAPTRYVGSVGAGSHIAYGVLGELAEARGDAAAAERLYRRALDLSPTFVAPVLPLAALLLARGVPPEQLAEELPLDGARARVLSATACLEAGHPVPAEGLLRAALGADARNDTARVALVESLLGQRRYADAIAEAALVRPDSPVAPVAASFACFAAAAGGDPAALDAALARAADAGVAGAELDLYRGWRAVLAGQAPPPVVAAGALEPALTALEGLLRVQEFVAFERLVAVYERIDVRPEERRERLAHLYLQRGFVDSAEEEWLRGDLDAAALVGLAQVALVRERPAEAAARAAAALDRDPSSPEARRLVEALGR